MMIPIMDDDADLDKLMLYIKAWLRFVYVVDSVPLIDVLKIDIKGITITLERTVTLVELAPKDKNCS